ncbi:PINIT domain-containing protein [Pseudomassariella vexata]|uniref:PINIT domain-domain-containing protein n=1 Tax=Pseudomassariella vexata TaxID=1141098 RepID=A0A1Y2ED81_9PEZI|nr:PINIT domain-containing protein [Pseudomassariella vexata]ORY69539.1 PINIT domain-domain-containing protein [Pseudomassariella vexata]
MASTSNSISSGEIAHLQTQLGTFLNKQLQSICAINGLKQSGIKADLQRRIIAALEENLHADPARYSQIRSSIQREMPNGRGQQQNNGTMGGGSGRGATYPANAIPQSFGQNGYNYGRGGYALEFKRSPFYTIESMIGEIRTCEETLAMSQHRNTITIPLKTSEFRDADRFAYDKNLRVMILCAEDDQGPQDISFPHQSELKVNSGEIKANLRGLKGKPGSTRPVDITSFLRLDKFSYQNNIEFTYALTNRVSKYSLPTSDSQKFYLALYVCKATPVEDLVMKIRGKKIARASVIQELTKAAHDPDVVATSQVLSLKCPLSYMRLRIPCRSVSCSHIQCFDGTSYLQLQEQGPQWVCPICNKSAPFDSLAIDEYAKDILDNTSESTEQVTIEPDGQWRKQSTAEPEPKKPRHSGVTASVIDDDDDDVVPLDDFSVISMRNTQTPSRSMLGTPASMSVNGGPTSANGSSSGTRKRPAEIIDLTLSDDDDEPIIRAPKRQNPGPTPTPSAAPAPPPAPLPAPPGLSFPNFQYS